MSLGLLVPTSVRSDVFFEQMPTNVREYLGTGFSKLAKLPQASLTGVASQVNGWLDPVEPGPEIDSLARKFKVGHPDMAAIIGAVSLLASACFGGPSPMPLDTFVAKAKKAGILRASDAAEIQVFGDEFLTPHRLALFDALARENSSTNIVPSFQHLATAVDLRVVAVNDERVVTVPVVIATLQTDVGDKELLFQMTPRDVDQLLRQLQELSEQLSRSKTATIHLAPQE